MRNSIQSNHTNLILIYSNVFVACGLNHQTAPLSVREQIAMPEAFQASMLHRLADFPAIAEAAILSTCNRTEIYCHTQDTTAVLEWLTREHALQLQDIKSYLYLHTQTEAIRHALRVASGLDSMMLGEPQILGQMKQAYQRACEVGSVRHHLRQTFQFVFRASKKIRHQSGISNNPISIAFAAVQLISQCFTHLKSLRVLIIGSGEMASLVAKYLQQQGVKHFTIASRDPDKAQNLAKNLAGEGLAISDLHLYLDKADVVISATACPLPFISKSLIEQAMKQRQQLPMFLLDLAVPRDIELEVGELGNVHLYNIDDLKAMTEKGMDERRAAALKAEQLVDYELDNYLQERRSLQAKEVICDYRSQMQELAQQELERAIQKLAAGQCQYQVLTEFSERLVKKLTHTPTVGLRQAARDNRKDLLDLAQYILNSSLEAITHETIT